MSALFLPSAHSFICSVEVKVNVDERMISVTMGPLTPRRLGSPPWMAVVWGPSIAGLMDFMRKSVYLTGRQKQPPNWRGRRQIGLNAVSYGCSAKRKR